MPSTLNLTEITEPSYVLNIPGGEAKTYKLWDLVAKLQAAHRDHGEDDFLAFWDAIRVAFELPTAAEYEKAKKKPFTLSPAQAIAAFGHVMETIGEAVESKKP